MAAEDCQLRELCAQVATGDPAAAREFRREVAPLLAVILRRSMPARHREQEQYVVRLARHACGAIIDRLQARQGRKIRETLPHRVGWWTYRPP